MLNMMCVEDDDDILGVRDELDRPEHGSLWNTAHDRRNNSQHFIVPCMNVVWRSGIIVIELHCRVQRNVFVAELVSCLVVLVFHCWVLCVEWFEVSACWVLDWEADIVMCSQHCQVLPWSTTPLRAADLRRVKLCGLALPDKKNSECMTFKKIQVWHSVCVEAMTVLTLKLICHFHIVTLIYFTYYILDNDSCKGCWYNVIL